MGYGLEVDMIRLARERDLLTARTSSTEGEARGDGARPAPTCSSRTWA